MGNVSSTNKSVQCSGNIKTQDDVQAKFSAAAKSGKDANIGYIGGYTAPLDGKRGYGQVKLVYRAKDKSIHIEGDKGKGYDKKLSSTPLAAISEARSFLKNDAVLRDKVIHLDEPCLKTITKASSIAPSKVGKQITVKYADGFMAIPKVKGGTEIAYYVAVYKTSDKYAIGMNNGKAVAVNAKLTDTPEKLREEVYKSIDRFSTDIFNPRRYLNWTIKPYTEAEAASFMDEQNKQKAEITKAAKNRT
jgi:hypothetical protein